MTIWKYPLQIIDEQIIPMPAGAEILCCQVQRGIVCLWARVDPSAATTERRIHIRGTGHPGATGEYIGTFQAENGALVFHVFDAGEAQ